MVCGRILSYGCSGSATVWFISSVFN